MLIILYFLKVLLFLNLGEERRANLTFTNRTLVIPEHHSSLGRSL